MTNKNIVEYIKPETIDLDLKSKNKNNVIKELFENIKKTGLVKDEDTALKDLFSREEMGSTGIGENVAVPHAKTNAVDEMVITVGISKEGIEYNSIDEKNVNIFFLFLCPKNNIQEYLRILAKISRIIKEDKFREELIKAKTSEELMSIIEKNETNN